MKNEGTKYDLIASEFAKLRDSFSTEQKYIDYFISYLPEKANVLDVGCGSGYPIAAYMAQKGLQVTGVDASKKLLKIAKSKHPEVKFIYGDVRNVEINKKFDGVIEWWCLFHLPQEDHLNMISRFAGWLKPNGILEFTTGDREFQGTSSEMLNQELSYYSLDPPDYEKALQKNGFKLLLKESDQDQHLVWIAKKISN